MNSAKDRPEDRAACLNSRLSFSSRRIGYVVRTSLVRTELHICWQVQLSLVQQVIPVIALMRFVTEFCDEPLHVFYAHSESCTGLRDDVFFNHDAAEIVCAILQCDLADFG